MTSSRLLSHSDKLSRAFFLLATIAMRGIVPFFALFPAIGHFAKRPERQRFLSQSNQRNRCDSVDNNASSPLLSVFAPIFTFVCVIAIHPQLRMPSHQSSRISFWRIILEINNPLLFENPYYILVKNIHEEYNYKQHAFSRLPMLFTLCRVATDSGI